MPPPPPSLNLIINILHLRSTERVPIIWSNQSKIGVHFIRCISLIRFSISSRLENCWDFLRGPNFKISVTLFQTLIILILMLEHLLRGKYGIFVPHLVLVVPTALFARDNTNNIVPAADIIFHIKYYAIPLIFNTIRRFEVTYGGITGDIHFVCQNLFYS